jgi:hypothetical protein
MNTSQGNKVLVNTVYEIDFEMTEIKNSPDLNVYLTIFGLITDFKSLFLRICSNSQISIIWELTYSSLRYNLHQF